MIHASLKIYIINDQPCKQYKTIIMVGDYNTVLNTSMDRKVNHTTSYHSHPLKEITNVMDQLELVAIWTIKYPYLVRYTGRRLNKAS